MTSLLNRPRPRAALAALARVDDTAATRRTALRALPAALERRFDSAAAGDLRAVFELRVLASAGGPEARFELQVGDGTIVVRPGASPRAGAWIALSLADMIRLISGQSDVWPLMAAKRLDLGGEPFTALRFPALFGF